MKLTPVLSDSTEQIDGYLGTVRLGCASRNTDEICLLFCPTCCSRVSEPSCRLGVCSNPDCGADFAAALHALRDNFQEGVDEAP